LAPGWLEKEATDPNLLPRSIRGWPGLSIVVNDEMIPLHRVRSKRVLWSRSACSAQRSCQIIKPHATAWGQVMFKESLPCPVSHLKEWVWVPYQDAVAHPPRGPSYCGQIGQMPKSIFPKAKGHLSSHHSEFRLVSSTSIRRPAPPTYAPACPSFTNSSNSSRSCLSHNKSAYMKINQTQAIIHLGPGPLSARTSNPLA
jgi:hypothetical protein